MPRDIKIKDIFDKHFDGRDCEYAEDYTLFRTIEDWCYSNIPKDRWRFDYSTRLCVCGIDIPNSIIFYAPEDLVVFKLKFGL